MAAVHLERSDENVHEIAALHDMLGGAAGLDGLLGDLKYQARRSLLPRVLGRAVRRGIAFDSYDQRDRRWWPQGISTSADSSDQEVVGDGRRVLVTTWYSHEVDGVNQGSRLTFLDLDTLRYRHVLLVVPTLDEEGNLALEPLRIHAGGIVWIGPWLHIAATSRGFVTARVDDTIAVEGDNERPAELGVHDGRVHSYGHHYVLPVRFRYRAHSDDPDARLRHSFMSLARGSRPPTLVCGEYGRSGQSTRLAHYEIDPGSGMLVTGEDGFSRPSGLDAGGVGCSVEGEFSDQVGDAGGEQAEPDWQCPLHARAEYGGETGQERWSQGGPDDGERLSLQMIACAAAQACEIGTAAFAGQPEPLSQPRHVVAGVLPRESGQCSVERRSTGPQSGSECPEPAAEGRTQEDRRRWIHCAWLPPSSRTDRAGAASRASHHNETANSATTIAKINWPVTVA
jgi:hypothetical protein